MKVLVTGGAGFIGSHTVLLLLEAGHDVLVIDDLSNSSEESLRRVAEITGRTPGFVKANVRDRDVLDSAFESFAPEAVIHFAGKKAVGESVAIPVEYYRENIGSTITLLEAMKAYGCHNIVFSSSATVYGEGEPPFAETDPAGTATNPYGWTKAMNEQILHDAANADKQLAVAALRYFNPIGAHESGQIGEDPADIPNNLLPYVAQVATGKLDHVSVFGNDYDTPDGTGTRDYIHVMDLAQGHLAALEKINGNPGFYVWNLGTGNPYSVLEVIAAFSKAAGKQVPYEIVARRPGDVASSYADPTKARVELGWEAKRGLDQMCEDAYRWQSRNPNGYRS